MLAYAEALDTHALAEYCRSFIFMNMDALLRVESKQEALDLICHETSLGQHGCVDSVATMSRGLQPQEVDSMFQKVQKVHPAV